MQRDPCSGGERPGGGDADPEARERAGPDADGHAGDLAPTDAGHLHPLPHGRHQLARMAWRLEQPLRRRHVLEGLAVLAQDADARGGGGGVEADDRHSTWITRLSPPAWSIRTRAATRSILASPAAGHSTKPIRSGVR